MNGPSSPVPSKVGGCASLNSVGLPCQATRQRDSEFCFIHDPSRARERAEARRKGGLARLSKLDSRTPRKEVSISSVSDVLAFLQEAVADLLQERPSQQRARGLAYVALACLRTLEVGEMEARIQALENRLGGGPDNSRFQWRAS